MKKVVLSRRAFTRYFTSLPFFLSFFSQGSPFAARGSDKVLLDEPKKTVDFSVWPVDGKLEDIIGDGVNPGSGYRHLQETINTDSSFDGGHHIGVDFNTGKGDLDLGEEVKLIMPGVCIFIGDGGHRDLGKIAMFRHKLPTKKDIISRYCHLNGWHEDLKMGENYTAGEIIAYMGKSGWEQGFSHLHLDIGNIHVLNDHYTGIYADPWWYPHFTEIKNIRLYFLDPVPLIKKYLRLETFQEIKEKESTITKGGN